MATQTTKLTKSQLTALIQQSVATNLGVDLTQTGNSATVRFVNELDVPATVNYPQAVVTITTAN